MFSFKRDLRKKVEIEIYYRYGMHDSLRKIRKNMQNSYGFLYTLRVQARQYRRVTKFPFILIYERDLHTFDESQ